MPLPPFQNSTQSRTLSGGSETLDCATFNAPAGWQIIGFHGRSDDELDDGSIRIRSFPEMVINGIGADAGDNGGLWQDWNGNYQRWTVVD
jgi:hypothetical protein